MPHIDNEGYVPPLERAHRLMNEGGTEHKWANATGFVDIVLNELEKAEKEGEEWGKPVKDPQSYNPSVPIVYKDKQDFINQRIQPYLDRHQHLKGYIRSYAQDRVKQTQDSIKFEPEANPPEYNGCQKVTPDKLQTILELRSQGMTQQQIADEVELSRERVSQLLSTKTSVSDDYNIMNITKDNEGNKPTKKTQGTSQCYLIGRLKRDNPEILEEIGEGKKFKSVRQAAIHAGIVKPKITVQFDPGESGSQIASKLYQKLTDNQLKEIAFSILEYLNN